MTYIPLHHKYRPQTFSQLVGQDAIATTLSNALKQNRIAPAYLFTGARGTGKTSSARIFAKSLNCISVNAPTDKPCGVCQTCQEITKGNALDVIEIDAASNTGVDNIRELIERAQFAPVQCRYKVYVIDECLTGDTLVLTRNGLIRIDDPNLKNEEALSYNEKAQAWEYKKITGWVNRGQKETLRIKTQHSEIRCTGNHLIRTEAGWIPARNVREGMKILSPVPVVAAISSINMEPMDDCDDSIEDITFAAMPTAQNLAVWKQLWTMDHSASLRKDLPKFKFTQKDSQSQKISCLQNGSLTLATQHAVKPFNVHQAERDTTIFGWEQTHPENGLPIYDSSPPHQWITNLETIESVSPDGVEFVYDIEVEDNHNFVANGLTVHNCHMLTSASFNALLKTLEEPPEQVVFVLATTDPQRVLPTIISRCQRFDFRRIPIDDMTQHLTMIAEKEGIAIAEDALYLIAQISQGGLRDAESLLDQLSLLSGEVTVERVWDLVGAVPERDLMALIEAIAQSQPETVLDTTRRLMDRGREPLIVLQNLASFYRDLSIAKTAPDRGDLVALTSPTWTQLCEFAKGVSIGTILAGQQRLKESELQLKNSTQPRLWLEVTLMGLLPSAVPTESTQLAQSTRSTVAQSTVAQSTVAQAIAKPVQAIAPPIPEPIKTPVPATTPEPIPEPIQELPESDLTDLEQLWQTIISNLQPLGTQALLKQQGSLLSFDGEVAQIGVASKLLGLAQGRSKNIAAALTKTFGKEIKFSLVVAPTTATPQASTSPNVTEPLSTEPLSTEPSESRLPPPANITAPVISKPILEEPPQQSYKLSDWEDDEVARAARTLAEAFNGSVVDADETEIEAIGSSDEIPELEETIEEDDTEF